MSAVQNFNFRRSQVSDVPKINKVIGNEAFMYVKRYGEDYNIHTLIEQNFLSITAVSPDDEVVGFASFSDLPTTCKGIPSAQWEQWLKSGWLDDKKLLADIFPCNTLWCTFFAATKTAEFDIAMRIFMTAFTTLPQVHHFLFAQSKDAPTFSPVKDIFQGVKESSSKPPPDVHVYHKCPWKGSILHLHRTEVIPELSLRAGVVEDYDDLMPLIMSGEGLVTPLPPQLFLEELLQDQNENKAVVVAEDPLTGAVVGLMCMCAESSDLPHYVIGDYQELKQIVSRAHGRHHKQQAPQGAANAANAVIHITFFYLNPVYDNRANQFLPFAFETFANSEYIYIQLPHAQPEHPILHPFTYIPIKEFKPMGTERGALEGLWLSNRALLSSVVVTPIATVHETPITKLISQSELPQELTEAMCLALTQSVPVGEEESPNTSTSGGKKEAMPFASYVMEWGDQVVGAVVIRHVTLEELYHLRENFSLDDFVNFVPHGDHHYGMTDISVDPAIAQSTFYRNDMPGIIVKHAYLKPIFRSRMRFFLREVLRFTDTQLVLNTAGPTSQTYTPLLAELVWTPPRRMIDQPSDKGEEDVDSLVCLHHTTRKNLSDEKTKIHARIVVIGAGATGLAFIYSLVKIPYLHFDNILLVSRDGLPNHPMHRDLLWTVDTLDWMEREYIVLQTGKKFRIIEDTMTGFDKDEKYIQLESSQHRNEPYDYLIIAAGRQYTLPKELASKRAKGGVFALSHKKNIDAIKHQIHESEIYEDDRSNVVIYGTNLDVYAAATAIKDLGLAPQRIAIVSPGRTLDDQDRMHGPLFGDNLVEMKVEQLLESLNIKLYKDHELKDLECDDESNLRSVTIQAVNGGPSAKLIDITASMFIYAHEKDIDMQILGALNKQAIVFDGRVIIEDSYRTNNKRIFAAGPVAMFSRRFGESPDFDIYSALEIGQALCNTVLGFLGIDEFFSNELDAEDKSMAPKDDPLAAQIGSMNTPEAKEEQAKKRPKPLPVYTENVSRRVILPDGYQFFMVYSLNYDAIQESCMQLTSGKKDINSYLRISISPNKYIECIVYFGNEPVEIYNLQSLVGLPESTLNVVYNFVEHKDGNGEPTLDLLSFLRSSWTHGIFYDRFLSVAKVIREKLRTHPDVIRVKQDLLQIALKEGVASMTDEERFTYHRRLTHDASDARHLIEFELIKYLHQNKAFIPQLYFLPDVSAQVTEEFEGQK